MQYLIDQSDVEALFLGHAPIDMFGPDTDYPYLALTLSPDAPMSMAQWVEHLPCPVIGIGDGNLAAACDIVLGTEHKLGILDTHIRRAPLAAMVLVQHLRASQGLSILDALTAESFAYSTVQQGPEFGRWLAAHALKPTQTLDSPPLRIQRKEDDITIIMDHPQTRNAIGTEMRDALGEAFDLAAMDNSITRVHLKSSASVFSIGGDIDEFGTVSDPATAHWIRSLRLPARRIAQIADRLHVHVNGAAIGAGTEIAAFGAHVTASKNAWFQLPELKYGLIPGAGGTVSLPRRIGRQRAAYMALTMEKIRAKTALEWGLIDAII